MMMIFVDQPACQQLQSCLAYELTSPVLVLSDSEFGMGGLRIQLLGRLSSVLARPQPKEGEGSEAPAPASQQQVFAPLVAYVGEDVTGRREVRPCWEFGSCFISWCCWVEAESVTAVSSRRAGGRVGAVRDVPGCRGAG